jgi:hypothetical protein
VKVVYPFGIFVKKAGDTMTGPLRVNITNTTDNPLTLNTPSGNPGKCIVLQRNASERGSIILNADDYVELWANYQTVSLHGIALKVLSSKQYQKAWVEVAEGSFATNGVSTTFTGSIAFTNAFSVVHSVVAVLCPAGTYTSQAYGIFLYPVSSTGVTWDVTFASAPASGQVYIVRVWALGY